MNCMEARRMVTPFIKRELSDREAEQFLRHIEHCSDCMDELDMYFTVYKALDTLESGVHNELDFQKMLEADIRFVKRGIQRRKAVKAMRSVTLIAVELLLLLSVYAGYRVRKSEAEQNRSQKKSTVSDRAQEESTELNRVQDESTEMNHIQDESTEMNHIQDESTAMNKAQDKSTEVNSAQDGSTK